MLKNSNSHSQDRTDSLAQSYQHIFQAQSGQALLLSPQFTILDVSDAYLQEALMARENLIGKNVFEVFPDNPDVPESDASQQLKASLQKVLATAKPHVLEKLRYDIPDPDRYGSFLVRYWNTINSPIKNKAGNVISILHEVVNVSDEVKAKQELEESRKREQTALAQAEQHRLRLERFFDQAPAALAMLEGPDFIYRVLNESYQQLFPGREMLNLPLFEALPELKTQPVYDILRNVYATGETYEGNEVLIPVARYEGQPMEDIYWNFIYQALFDAEGNVNGILIFALDVTEFVNARQQVENSAATLQAVNRQLEDNISLRTEELEHAQAEAERQSLRLESLFMQAPAAICILEGPDLVYKLVNPGYQQLFPERALLGKPILEALPEIKDNIVYTTFRKVYDTGYTHEESELLIPFIRPEDGVLEDRYFRFVQQPRYDKLGKVDGVVVFALEVTELVRARKAVEASEQQLRLITDALPVLISYLDKEVRYRFANRAYETWFNLKVTDILGMRVLDVVGEKAYAESKGHIQKALAGERVDYEATMPYREGLRHVRVSYVPDFQSGEVVGFYALISDYTEQVNSRRALERREQEAYVMANELSVVNKRLTHINADLDNFIYTASHDLKAPISNIEMLMDELVVELPQESLERDAVKNIISMMKGSVGRFKKTISNLTEISKLQKDEFFTEDKVQVDEIVNEVKLDLDQLIVKSAASIEMTTDGCLSVSFSEKNMRSIVYNLLSNAIKYRHPDRALVISIDCQEDGEFVVLKVQDNGLGLNARQQEKLFSMFRRFHDHVEGSGVGLYMVKRIVDNAGGRIEVESDTEVGSTFSVYLKK